MTTNKILIRNVMSIGFKPNKESTNVEDIEFCIKSDKQFSGMIEHSDDISLLPADVEIPVTSEKIFTIYPEGQFIMDVFECYGEAEILQGSS